MQWKNSRIGFDYRKLKSYKTDLKYEYAVYLELDETKYLLDFINN